MTLSARRRRARERALTRGQRGTGSRPILPLDAWAGRQACTHARAWIGAPPHYPVACRVSATLGRRVLLVPCGGAGAWAHPPSVCDVLAAVVVGQQAAGVRIREGAVALPRVRAAPAAAALSCRRCAWSPRRASRLAPLPVTLPHWPPARPRRPPAPPPAPPVPAKRPAHRMALSEELARAGAWGPARACCIPDGGGRGGLGGRHGRWGGAPPSPPTSFEPHPAPHRSRAFSPARPRGAAAGGQRGPRRAVPHQGARDRSLEV